MIFRFFVSLNLIYIVTGSKYGNSGECLNQHSSYGYDLNDLNSDCDATQFCSLSNICIPKYNDGVPIYGANPKVVCKNGYSEVEQTIDSFVVVCSSTPVGEVCISGPNACDTNYCMDPWGFPYPAERIPDTDIESQLKESLSLLNVALKEKNLAFTNYAQSINYATLSSDAYIVYLKYVYFVDTKKLHINNFYENFLNDESLPGYDKDFMRFKQSKKSCTVINYAVKTEFDRTDEYATKIMTKLDTLLNNLKLSSNSSDLASRAYSKFFEIYNLPINLAKYVSENIQSPLSNFNRCDSTESYIDAQVKKSIYDGKKLIYETTEKAYNEIAGINFDYKHAKTPYYKNDGNCDYNMNTPEECEAAVNEFQLNNTDKTTWSYDFGYEWWCPTRNMEYITTREECEAAAISLGNSDTTVGETVNSLSKTPGCFVSSTGGLWFNENFSSQIRCNEGNAEKCFCKTKNSESRDDIPPGCFVSATGLLSFNKNFDSPITCGEQGTSCVCYGEQIEISESDYVYNSNKMLSEGANKITIGEALSRNRTDIIVTVSDGVLIMEKYSKSSVATIGFPTIRFKCRETCYDSTTHKPIVNIIKPACPPALPNCVGYGMLSESDDEIMNGGCSFRIDTSMRLKIHWNANSIGAPLGQFGWSYVCALTRSPRKYMFSVFKCPEPYEIRTREQCFSVVQSIKREEPGLGTHNHITLPNGDSYEPRPNGYTFSERVNFTFGKTCNGYKEEDYLVTNHWSSNWSKTWTTQSPANAYSDFGPCGKYGTCISVPNPTIEPPLMKISPFINETTRYYNNITCKCKRGEGYFCEQSLCDGYCKNNGVCTLIGGEPECECSSGYFGPDCSLTDLEGESNGHWERNGNDHALWWVFDEGNSLTTYDTLESEYGDDGGDEANVVVASKQHFACFGSYESCNGMPKDNNDKSMIVMLTDMASMYAEDFDNIGNWFQITFAFDSGKSWNEKRQKSIDSITPRFDYYNSKSLNNEILFTDYNQSFMAETLMINNFYDEYDTSTDNFLKLNLWNEYVNKLTALSTFLLQKINHQNNISMSNVEDINKTEIKEFDCDYVGDKSIDDWTCCSDSNLSMLCTDDSCWNKNDVIKNKKSEVDVLWTSSKGILHQTSKECNSKDTYLGKFDTLDKCAQECSSHNNCKYFLYGNDETTSKSCYIEHTISDDCPEGFVSNNYNFYELNVEPVTEGSSNLYPVQLKNVMMSRDVIGDGTTGTFDLSNDVEEYIWLCSPDIGSLIRPPSIGNSLTGFYTDKKYDEVSIYHSESNKFIKVDGNWYQRNGDSGKFFYEQCNKLFDSPPELGGRIVTSSVWFFVVYDFDWGKYTPITANKILIDDSSGTPIESEFLMKGYHFKVKTRSNKNDGVVIPVTNGNTFWLDSFYKNVILHGYSPTCVNPNVLGTDASCLPPQITTTNTCSGTCDSIGDKCTEGTGKTCCRMENLENSICDSEYCWVNNENIGTLPLENCQRGFKSSCENSWDCENIGDVCRNTLGHQFICCDWWNPGKCSSPQERGTCWHRLDDLHLQNINIFNRISTSTLQQLYNATEIRNKFIDVLTADEVIEKVGIALNIDRPEGEVEKTIDFSITAMTPKATVPLLSLSDFFSTLIDIIFYESPEGVRSGIKIFTNVILIPVQLMIPDIRSVKVAVRMSSKSAAAILTIRPNFVFSADMCVNQPENVLCLLGELGTMLLGESEVQKFEQLMQSLKFKFKAQFKKSRGGQIQKKITLSLGLPIVLSDTDEMYLALETENGAGPSMFSMWQMEDIFNQKTVKIIYGGTIPFHLKIGKKIDITLIGTLMYTIGKGTTLQVRMPMWLMDILPFTQIPVHVHDLFIKIDLFKIPAATSRRLSNIQSKDITLKAAAAGRNIQFMGGLCLGTENNCRMKTCDYIQGYFFKNINMKYPIENMQAILMSEVSFSKLLKVMCSSEWFGFCSTSEDKSQFMSSIYNVEQNFPWLIGFGWLPLTPPCSDPADTIGDGCCTREELLDAGKSFGKQCYSKIVYSPGADFAFKTQYSTIIIEKGITISGRLLLFGYGINVYFKFNEYMVGPIKRRELDGSLIFDKMDIGGIFRLTRNETSNEGPIIKMKLRQPISFTFHVEGYAQIPPLAIGVGFHGQLFSNKKIVMNASLSLFGVFDAHLEGTAWLSPPDMIAHQGSTGARIRVDISGLNKFVSGAVAIARAEVAKSRQEITDGLTTFQNNLVSSSSICLSIFPTLGMPTDGDMYDVLLHFEFLGKTLYKVLTDFIEGACVKIMDTIIPIFVEGVKLIVTGIWSAVEILLKGIEMMADGDIVSLDMMELRAYVGFGDETSGLQLKGKLFGVPYHVDVNLDRAVNFIGKISNPIGAIFDLIKDSNSGGRRLMNNSHGGRRLTNKQDETVAKIDSVIKKLSDIVPIMGTNLEKTFQNLVAGKFDEAAQHFDIAMNAPSDALALLNDGTRRLSNNNGRRKLSSTDIEKTVCDGTGNAVSGDCNLLLVTIYDLTKICIFKECKYGCRLDSKCYECKNGEVGSDSSDTDCGKGQFCDLGKCIEQKPYGALIGIFNAKTVCLSGIADGTLPTSMCVDCVSDSDCVKKAIDSCEKDPTVGRYNGTETSKRRLFCDSNSQCKSESIQSKRKDYVTCLNIGGCCDRYGHLWEKGCNAGDVRRFETVTPKCTHNCCRKDNGVYVAGVECNKKTQIKRGEFKAKDDSTYRISQESCKWGCCNLDGLDAGYTGATYCPNYYRNDVLPTVETCGYDCCKEGSIRHGAGFFILPTDCAQNRRNGECICDYIQGDAVYSGEYFAYKSPIPSDWNDAYGRACGRNFREFPYWTYLYGNHECGSPDTFIDHYGTLKECADACRARVGCKYFIYGNSGSKAGNCYEEHTTGDNCPGYPWVSGPFDFYKLDESKKTYTYNGIQYGIHPTYGKHHKKGESGEWSYDYSGKVLYFGYECGSDDTYLGSFSSVSGCENACKATAGCEYFIYGYGSKSGKCYQEHMTADNCPGYPWIAKEYDIYKLTRHECFGVARGEFVMDTIFGSMYCAHNCCDRVGFSGMYNTKTCAEPDDNPNWRGRYMTTREDWYITGWGQCFWGCCKYYTGVVTGWKKPGCTDWQTVFETGRVMANYHPSDYIYTKGQYVNLPCDHTCCFPDGFVEVQQRYCKHFTDAQLSDSEITTDLSMWKSDKTRTTFGKKIQPRCTHHCCTDKGLVSSMEFHGECPSTVDGVPVVKYGEVLGYTEKCMMGCCSTDGTTKDHYGHNKGCIAHPGERSYLPGHSYGGHTAVGDKFYQELDCDSVLQNEYNDCKDSTRCEYENTYGKYKPNCLHRTPLLLWSDKSLGGWGEFCNSISDENKWEAEKYADNVEQYSTTSTGLALQAMQYAQEAQNYATISSATSVDTGEATFYANKASEAAASAQIAKNNILQSATTARSAANIGDVSVAQSQQTNAYNALNDVKEFTSQAQKLSNDVRVISENNVERERISQLGPFTKDWWFYINPNSEFDGNQRSFTYKNTYTHINDKSCSYYGSSSIASANECQRAAEQLGIIFSNYKVSSVSNSAEPTGCYLWSSSADGNNLSLYYNEVASSTTSCGWEQRSQYQSNSGGCLCIDKYAKLSTGDTCDSAGLTSIGSAGECKKAAIQLGIASSNDVLKITSDTDASRTSPSCFQRQDGQVEYNEVSKKHEPILRHGFCIKNVDSAAKCFAIADRMGLAGRPRRFESYPGWNCNNIGDTTDDGYKCCSGSNNGCNDGTCWWASSAGSEAGTCEQTVTTPIENSWDHTPSGCFIDENFTPHFNTKSTTVPCGGTYPCICDELIRSGTCESVGYNTIDTAAKCWKYAVERGWGHGTNYEGSWGHLAPGCTVDPYGNPHFNSYSSGNTCSDSYGCICDTLLRSGTCNNIIQYKHECFKSAIAKGFRSVRHTSGSWGHVPQGCSISSDGEALFNDASSSVVCSNTYGCICSTTTTKKCDVADCNGLICSNKYATITLGTCASNGYSYIRSKYDCQLATNAQNKLYMKSPVQDEIDLDKPAYCYMDNDGMTHYNNLDWNQRPVCDGTFSIPFSWYTTSTFTSCSQFQNEIGPYTGENTGGWLVDACQTGFQGGDCSTIGLSFGKTACNWGKQAKKASNKGCCVAGSFSIPFDWWTTSTFTSCSQLQNEIGPYAGTNNGGWIVNTCQMGFQGVDCSNVASGYGRTACQWGSNAKKASIQGCLCLLDSKCGATQVLNSDKASSNSITGINGDTVYFICDLGYYIKNSDFMRGGSMTCGGDGNFKFDVGSDICVPMMRSNISSMIYGSLTPESKFRHISTANSKHFTDLRVSKNVKQATQYSKMRISANELPTNISKDITNIYQSQKLEIYTQNNTLLTDSCEKGTDCCDISLDISMDTKIQLSIPNANLKKAGFCRNPIKSKEECASAVKSLNFSAYNYNIKPSLVYSYQDIPCDICSTYKFNITVNTIPNTSPHYGRLDPPGCFLYKDEANSDKIIPYFNPELNSKTDCSYSNRALENYAGGCICLEDSYEYVQIHSGYCDKPIITTNECILAVKTLQLSLKYPYSAESKQITEGSWPLKPYGCSISKADAQTDDVVVYFNTYISSNSDCSYKSDNTDGCICKSKEDTIPVVSLPNREGSWSITCNKNKAIAKQTLTTLSSSSLSVISSNNKNKCVKRITDIDSCNIAANTLGIDGSVQIISKNNIAEGCYHTSYEPITTGQCEEIERIDTIEECQVAVGFLGYSESVTIDSNAPYGCSLWRQASTGVIFVYFNPDVNDIKDAGSSLVGTYYYQSICRNKKAYLNVHSSDIGCSESNKCICYGEYYSNTVKMECWDDYMRKWDTPFEKQDNYLKCNHHKITALTNTIIPMQCPSMEILNSDKSSVGSINGTIFSSVQVNCDDGFFGGGTSTCDYHIDKNDKVENKYDVYHRKSGICERDILNKRDCYEMVKSLDLTKIQMDKSYSGTKSNIFIENSNKKCTNSITSVEECYAAVKVLALDMVDTTEKNIRTIREQMDTTPAGCILWKEPYTNKYIAYFNPKLTSEEPCNSNYTGCICKSETHFKMNTHQHMCQNIEQTNITIEDIDYAPNNKWYSPFTSVDIIPDTLNALLYPHGCFLYKINNDNEQIRAYFNPSYSNIDCATNKSNYAGCVCQPIYTNLSSGTCESNGHMTIHSTKNCQVALSLFNKGIFGDMNPQVITESSDCICTKKNETDIFNNSYVPKPHGCTQTDNGDKFLNIFTSNTECSNINECMCKIDTKNNVFYSSFGSCLTIGDGYAPLTTNTKCLEAAIDTGIVSIDSTTNVVEVFNPELPSNCIYSKQGNLILNSAPTTKLCSNNDTEGCFCEKKYFYIEHGTCDSQGYAPIKSEELCKEASISLNRPWKSKLNKDESRFTIIENTNALPNCWEDNDGSLILNKKTSIRKCSKTSGCFCQRKRVAKFNNMACNSISDCTPTEVPNSNASNIGSITGKGSIHVECDTGYSGGGTVTCNQHTGLFSTTSCHYCSKGYGYASVTNHTCVRCTDQGVGTNATYNDAPYSSSICAQQKCPFGMGISNLNSSLLNIDVAQDCVKCPENTFSNSSEHGQCQNVQPGYVVKTNETLNNLLQVAPKRTEVLDISSWISTNSVFSARRRRLARKRKYNRQLYFSEMLFIYEKVLFEILSISNSLLCELNLMMAKAKKELGLIQNIEIEQAKCWLPQDTNMPENNGKYFVKADGTKDTSYFVSVPTSVKTPTTFTYNMDENTISFGTQQYGGTFAAITNPTSQLEYGEFVLKWNSTSFGTNNYIGGHLSALVSNDGHYILRNYVKNNDDGIIQEEFLYRNITGKWTKTRREQNDNIQTKNAMRSSSGRTIIETDFNGAKNTNCYENYYSPVYDFQIDGVTTVINQMTLVDCGSETLSNIPSVNFNEMKDLDVEKIVYSRQIRIGQIEITCKVDSIDNSVQNSVVLSAGQSIQVQCDPGYEVLHNHDTISCQMNGTYNIDSVQCVKSNCTKSFVENSNVSNFGDIYGVTGDSHYVQCDPGYLGSGVTTCMTSGLFSPIVCSKRQCSSCDICFNQNKNLLTPNFDAYYQDTINVQCKAGYSSPLSSVTCQSNGVFTSVQCNQSACIINITNSNAQGNIVQHNSSMDIICDQGYEGGGLVDCNSDSTFTPDVHCTPKVCAPSNVPNSDKSQQGSIVGFTGKSVYVQCDQGYTGSAMSECMPSGIFSSVICSPIQCSTNTLPEGVANTQLSGYYGQPTQLNCAYGYEGGGDVSCDVNGNFNIQNNICTRKKCLVSVPNSNTNNKILSYQENINVQCDSAYNGGGLFVCGVNGQYTGTTCTPKVCAPTQIENSNKAEIGSIQGVYGQVVKIKCNPLYRPFSSEGIVSQNSIMITCLTSGVFQSGECQIMYNFDVPRDTVVKKNYILTIASEIRNMHIDKNERKSNMAKLSRQLYTSNKVEGLSKRQTVKQSKLEIVKDDLDDIILKKIPKTSRKVYIIPAPPNSGSIDTCSNGVNDDDCCTYSFSDDTDLHNDDIPVHETGEEIGSWSILCKGDVIVSKQTRENNGLKMECWDEYNKLWGNAMPNMSAGDYYKCQSHTILVGSQTPLGTTCETNAVSSSNYSNVSSITAFVDETITVQCDANYIGGGSLTCGADGNFSNNNVECFPVYNGNIQYDCQNAKRIYQENLCCSGTVSTILVHNDKLISCFELREQYKPNCGCGSDTDMVVVSFQ